MAAERGSAFLLKIGDGAATPAYATVAGLKTRRPSSMPFPSSMRRKRA